MFFRCIDMWWRFSALVEEGILVPYLYLNKWLGPFAKCFCCIKTQAKYLCSCLSSMSTPFNGFTENWTLVCVCNKRAFVVSSSRCWFSLQTRKHCCRIVWCNARFCDVSDSNHRMIPMQQQTSFIQTVAKTPKRKIFSCDMLPCVVPSSSNFCN